MGVLAVAHHLDAFQPQIDLCRQVGSLLRTVRFLWLLAGQEVCDGCIVGGCVTKGLQRQRLAGLDIERAVRDGQGHAVIVARLADDRYRFEILGCGA